MPTAPKKFVDDLSTWVAEKKTRPRQDKHAVAFLAIRNDVAEALDAGYSMRTIWEYLKEKGSIEGRYETFTIHVRKYVRTEPAPTTFPVPALSPSPARPAPPLPQSKPARVAPGFNFDSTPKKEDLI